MHIGIFYKDYERYGGIPTEYRRFAYELGAMGEKVTIYTYAGEDTPKFSTNVTVKKFTGSKYSSFRLPGDLIQALKQDSGELDILEIFGGYFLENITVSKLAQRIGLPYVFTPDGDLAPKVIRHKNRWKKRLYIWVFLRKVMRNAVGLHVFSRMEGEWVRKYTKRPLIQTSFGAFVEDIPRDLDTRFLHKKLDLTNDNIILLYLGRLDPYWKGLQTLIEAFTSISASNPVARLVLIGPDQGGSRQKLQRQVIAAGLNDTVTILDPVYGDAKFSAYASADLFVSPSNMDCIPRSIREALATGCPALVSMETHCGEIIETYRAGEMCAVDSHDISSRITRLISDRDKLASMRENAVRAAHEGFNWKIHATALRDGYKELLENTI